MNKYEILRLLSVKTNRIILSVLDKTPTPSKEIIDKVKKEAKIKNRESVYKALEKLKDVGLIEKKFDQENGNLYYSKKYKKIIINLHSMNIIKK